MPDDGTRRELVKGELREMPPAGALHGNVAMNLAAVGNHVKSRRLGTMAAAGTGFISQRRFPKEGPPDGHWELTPDLAVEVVSPNDTATEVQGKVGTWLEAGVRLVWAVIPTRNPS